MLRILDKNKVPVKGLRKYSDLCIENSIELDDKTLTFSVPYRNVRSAIAVEGYIETKDDRFVVKEIEKSSEGTATITAQLDLESLEGKPFRAFKSEEQTIKATLQLAFAGTGWTVGECSVSKKRTLSMANVSALDVLKQALKTYRAEIKIDSKKQSIDIYPEVGSDKGVYFSDQLNLRKLTVQYSTYDFYTEIEPYGKDGLTIETVNSGKTYLENHQYSSKKKRCIWKDERYTIADSLKEDAAAKLADMSKPYVSYSADIVDLSRNSQKYSILQYEIGDTVTLIDHVTGEKEKQRIVSMKIYPEAPEKNSCTLANKVLTFDELAQKYEDTADTVDNITNDNGQVDGDAIDGIHSRQIIDLENGIIESAYIKELGVKYLDVSGKITAVEGEFGILKSNTAQFEETYTKRLEAVEGDIYTLRTTDFTAVNAKIGILDNEFGNIKILLSGGAGIGEIQNIHLTSENAVIDSALIRSAVMQTVSVADLLAGTISTNKFLIASDDGGIRIQGATQQWSDEDGTVRMQAGRDANGDFTFSLFDKTGKGILIDATGVKPDAIADGLIVNKMVADNAGIAGSKLDIPSVVSAINDSSQTIKSSRIWFDEQNQSLNQTYSQLNQNVTEIRSTASSAASKADAANETAGAASKTAQQALSVLSGISTLDAIGAALNNDAHVVHTNTDGSGGDYSDCFSKMTVYLGDTDVSDDSVFSVSTSAGITGHWDDASRTYYVTAMSADNGYVDIDALYGTGDRYLTTRKGLRLTTRSGKYILVQSGGAHIRKRFSISKAKDGKIGLSYDLHSSTLAVRKQKDGKTLIPASITFSATQNDTGQVRSYSGRYSIQETEDETTYTLKYVSTSDEIQKIYTPSSVNVKAVRCTLLSAGGVSELDTQTVIILADAEGLSDDIKKAQDTADAAKEAIVTTNQNVANIESGMDGFRAELKQTTTDLHGLTDNTLLYNVKYQDNGNDTTTLSAVLYKNGNDVTKLYPARWYTWNRKTESGQSYLGYGYSITVKNSDYEFGGVTIGSFTTYDTMNLTTRSGNQLTTRSGNHLTVWREN
nr:MAG TPA: tail protein [Caudoviricetes sp.]